MFALPYLSGTEFVALLARFGYLPRSRTGGLAALQREANVVIVPEASTLSPTLVRAILRTANVDPHEFLHVIDHPPPFGLSAGLRPDLDHPPPFGLSAPHSKKVA